MNKERILALAALIEAQPHTPLRAREGFNMANWNHGCGTPSCIAGFACSLAGAVVFGWNTMNYAKDYLELTEQQSENLFLPWGGCSDEARSKYLAVTPAQAALTLRKLAETGKIDWSHAE